MTNYGIATQLDAVRLAAPTTLRFQGITVSSLGTSVPSTGFRPAGTPIALDPDSSV